MDTEGIEEGIGMTDWKKRCLKCVALLFGAALLILGISRSVQAKEPYEAISNANEWEVLKLLNRERLSDGKEAVSIFSDLQKASGVRAKEIKTVFSHQRPDGSDCFSVIQEYSIPYSYLGENIAAGYQNPAAVMQGWMNSPGHKSNILNASFDHVGIGYAEGGSYGKNWVQIFVGGCNVTDLAVNETAATYRTGTKIDDMNRYLTVTCSQHGKSYVPVIAEMCSGYKSARTGKQNVKVSYQGKQVTMTVDILADVTDQDAQQGQTQQDGQQDNDSKAPSRVTGLKASKVTTHSVRLTWTKKKCDGYEIWRATSKKGTYKKIKTITRSSTHSFRNSKLRAGQRYYYKVRAYVKEGSTKKYGAFSAIRAVRLKK